MMFSDKKTKQIVNKMIKDLREIKREEVNLFGGKATNLGFLTQKGFNVPDGFCISTQITQLSNNVKKEIIAKFKKLNTSVSVRSSATSEDAKNLSFAGQFDTYLNINSEDKLLTSIEKCWRSLHSDRAREYSKENSISDRKMAIIIQKMVDADFAGVIFTVDPIDKKNILIELVKGLANKLVSGEITPSSYLISRDSLKIVKKKRVVQN